MKRVLLVVLFIISMILIGCEANNDEIITNNNHENTTNEMDISNLSFEERTEEVRNYISQDNVYFLSPSGDGELWGNHYNDNVSLGKEDSYYVMNVKFYTPKIYEKEDIEKVYDSAQANGQAELDGYTFYKDNILPLLNESLDGYAKNLVNNEEGCILATKKDEDKLYIFRSIPNDIKKYYVMWDDIDYGEIVYEFEKDIDVILLPNDKMTITFDRDLAYTNSEELTVEEYYVKAINKEVASNDSIIGFKYSLNSVGNAILPWSVTNAVNFDNGSINVSYHYGGI